MSISDDDLVRQLESVPMVNPPDFREPVLRQLRVEDRRSRLSGQAGLPVLQFPRHRLYLGLAWAAAVAIVLGVVLARTSDLRPQNAAATMAATPAEEWPIIARVSSRADGSTLTVRRNGDQFAIESNVKGVIDWDRSKLSKIETLPDDTVVLQRQDDASGSASIRLSVAGREVLKTDISVD